MKRRSYLSGTVEFCVAFFLRDNRAAALVRRGTKRNGSSTLNFHRLIILWLSTDRPIDRESKPPSIDERKTRTCQKSSELDDTAVDRRVRRLLPNAQRRNVNYRDGVECIDKIQRHVSSFVSRSRAWLSLCVVKINRTLLQILFERITSLCLFSMNKHQRYLINRKIIQHQRALKEKTRERN